MRANFHFFTHVVTFFLIAIIFISVFSVSVYAQDTTTSTADATTGVEVESVVVATVVDTILLVNPEDHIDWAIAMAVAQDHNYPIIYTNPDGNTISDESLRILASGTYADVKEVYVIGGTSVVSPELFEAIEGYGEDYAGFDVARVAGTTATGTAVEALQQFYGPGLVEEVTYKMKLLKDWGLLLKQKDLLYQLLLMQGEFPLLFLVLWMNLALKQ